MKFEALLMTYELRVFGPRNDDGTLPEFEFHQEFLRETEENLSDLLPEGYSVRISDPE